MANGLDAESIREIVSLADARRTAKFQRVEGEPEHIYWRLDPDGTADKVIADAPMLFRKMDRPADVVTFIGRIDPEEYRSEAAIFYDVVGVTCLPDATDNRASVFCPLELSPQMRWLTTQAKQPLSQRDFVRLLRIDLRGCFAAYPTLLSMVRNLRWTGTQFNDGAVSHGRESLGRAIEAQVSGADSIPEEITVTVPFWRQFPCSVSIACAIEILPQEQSFRLTPYPNEIDKATETALDALAAALESKNEHWPAIYRGNVCDK